MKKMIVALAMFASTAATADQAGIMRARPGTFDGFTSVSCRDARNIADAGVSVAITQHGRTQFIEISEQSFMGPRPVGTLPVRVALDQRNNREVFAAQGVQLVINLESFHVSTQGEMEAFIRGVVGQVRLDHDLRCQFFARAL